MLGPLNVRYRDYGGDIFSSGKHLLNLINEILDLAKLESGQFKLDEEEVDLAGIVRDSMRLVEAQAEKGRVELSEVLPADLPLLRADDRRMRQILINLLSNAVKFTPERGRVSVSVMRKNGGLAIEVRDTGIGIAARRNPPGHGAVRPGRKPDQPQI